MTDLGDKVTPSKSGKFWTAAVRPGTGLNLSTIAAGERQLPCLRCGSDVVAVQLTPYEVAIPRNADHGLQRKLRQLAEQYDMIPYSLHPAFSSRPGSDIYQHVIAYPSSAAASRMHLTEGQPTEMMEG